MDEWEIITQYNWAFWVAGLFALFEFFRWAVGGLEWLGKTFGIETKKMRKTREWKERLEKVEKAIEEIKKTSESNVNMFLNHEKQVVDRFEGIKDMILVELQATAETDRAMLRDRIASGMRYFTQNMDEEGKVHISFSDYENMEALFQRYFARGGNGTFKKMYETEFQKFIIDR